MLVERKRTLIILMVAVFTIGTGMNSLWTASATRQIESSIDEVNNDGGVVVIVGFKPDLGLFVDKGLLAAPTGAKESLHLDLQKINKSGLELKPLFSRHVFSLRNERASADVGSDESFPDLTRWMMLEVPSDRNINEVLSFLKALPSVDDAHIKPQAYPASIGSDVKPAKVPDFTSMQGYMNKAPAGLNVSYAWTRDGGTGSNVTVADVEGDWNQKHIDLAAARKKKINGIRLGTALWYDHGTAVAGIISATNNSKGVTGIAYDAKLLLFSIGRKNGNGEINTNVPDAINRAASSLKAGDILLLEVQYGGLVSNYEYIPVEYYDEDFEVIQAAVAKGIIVVEAAGNGYQNLDGVKYQNRFNTKIRGDSGAIMVGAGGTKKSASDRKKLSFSNFGKRVDVQNWGHFVTTTGYGDLYQKRGDKKDFTSSFNGTSSASALTAALCACLQGFAKEYLGRPLTPEEMRNILKSTGYAQKGNKSLHIGPRPDLKRAILAVEKLEQ